MTKLWGLKVAIVEPATLVGRDVRSLIDERKLPVESLKLLHAGESHEGLLTAGEEDEVEFIAPFTPDALEECQLAFLCGGGRALAAGLEGRADSCLAIDVSGLRSGGPFVLPEADTGAPLPQGNLYLTHDPTAYVLWQALRLLQPLGAISGITAAVDRPASELGRAALDELFQQAIAIASFKGVPREVFSAQSAFNVFHPADSEDFEGRVKEDLTRLLGDEGIPISVLSARAGIFHGHHLRVEARFDGGAPDEREVLEALFAEGTGFTEPVEDELGGPVESAGRDDTLVLRVSASDGAVRLAMASDHLRRGGALLALRIAEQAVRERGFLADA